MRSRDNVSSDNFAESSSGRTTGFNSGFHSSDVTADHDAYESATDLFRTDKNNVSSLYHSIGSFDSCNKTSGFNHSKSFHLNFLLKNVYFFNYVFF